MIMQTRTRHSHKALSLWHLRQPNSCETPGSTQGARADAHQRSPFQVLGLQQGSHLFTPAFYCSHTSAATPSSIKEPTYYQVCIFLHVFVFFWNCVGLYPRVSRQGPPTLSQHRGNQQRKSRGRPAGGKRKRCGSADPVAGDPDHHGESYHSHLHNPQ